MRYVYRGNLMESDVQQIYLEQKCGITTIHAKFGSYFVLHCSWYSTSIELLHSEDKLDVWDLGYSCRNLH